MLSAIEKRKQIKAFCIHLFISCISRGDSEKVLSAMKINKADRTLSHSPVRYGNYDQGLA